MSVLGLLLMLGGPDPLPSERGAADALLYAMSCRDEDGFTLCDPSIPVEIEFTRFDCVSEPVRNGAELARAMCSIAGRVRYTGRRSGEYRWVPLGGDKAGFWLPRGAYARWQAFSEPHR